MTQASESPKVLIVDTDLNAMSSLKRALERADYEVIQAESFEEGKVLLTAERPTVLVAALKLGSFNGLHLLLHGRRERPNLVGIVTSPFADSTLEAEAHRLGGAYLVRPFNPEEVMALLSRMLPREIPPDTRRFEERRSLERRQTAIAGYVPERRVVDRRHSRSQA
jgi:DNA-binding response OmpR family regulator